MRSCFKGFKDDSIPEKSAVSRKRAVKQGVGGAHKRENICERKKRRNESNGNYKKECTPSFSPAMISGGLRRVCRASRNKVRRQALKSGRVKRVMVRR